MITQAKMSQIRAPTLSKGVRILRCPSNLSESPLGNCNNHHKEAEARKILSKFDEAIKDEVEYGYIISMVDS